jgi:hypothetical protein
MKSSAAIIAILLLCPIALPAAAQRLLLGRWQAEIGGAAAMLTIITADGVGWVHGVMTYEPPLAGFAGAPFTTQIVNGSFAIRFANGSRYEDLHWCAVTLCGTYYTLDGSATQVSFARTP